MRREQRRLADEVARARQVDGPREAGLQRIDGLVHVLSVQIHSRFQAQRVARAEPAGLDARGLQRLPEVGARARPAA